MKERVVIVGGGMAAARFVDELTTRAPGRHDITVIGEEKSRPYNRVLLSSLLARDVGEADLELTPDDWWKERRVTLISGEKVVAIDAEQRSVRLQFRPAVPFDTLVLATGSEPLRLPLPGIELPGVLTFRTQDDVAAMLARTNGNSRAVVIGGGLLGLEAAYGLAKAGAAVTVVHLMDRLMERQLDGRAGAMLKTALEARGIEVLLEAESAAIEGKGKVEGLRLADGRALPADLIVMAAGIRPRAELAREAGLTVKRGIVVDDHMQTSVPGVHALGECAEHRGVCYGLVEPAYEQARVLAQHLAGSKAAYEGSLLSTNLKVSGVDVFSAGDFLGGADAEPILFADPEHGVYRKLIVKDGRLAGAVLLGDTTDALWYLDLMRSGASIAAMREDLVFGRAFCVSGDESAAPQAEAA
jgi:nitrite reductase [NAD(P)H] large subunit